MQKKDMIEAIEMAAVFLGEALLDSQGRKRFGGHVFRVSGAMALAWAGVPKDQIKVLGRWTGEAIERYLRHAPVHATMEISRRPKKRSRVELAEVSDDDEEPRMSSSSGSKRPQVPTEVEPQDSGPNPKSGDLTEKILGDPKFEQYMQQRMSMVQSPAHRLVRSTRTAGKVHLALSVEGPKAGWSTVCGWKFGESQQASVLSAKSAESLGPGERCLVCTTRSLEAVPDFPKPER